MRCSWQQWSNLAGPPPPGGGPPGHFGVLGPPTPARLAAYHETLIPPPPSTRMDVFDVPDTTQNTTIWGGGVIRDFARPFRLSPTQWTSPQSPPLARPPPASAHPIPNEGPHFSVPSVGVGQHGEGGVHRFADMSDSTPLLLFLYFFSHPPQRTFLWCIFLNSRGCLFFVRKSGNPPVLFTPSLPCPYPPPPLPPQWPPTPAWPPFPKGTARFCHLGGVRQRGLGGGLVIISLTSRAYPPSCPFSLSPFAFLAADIL